MRLPAVVIDLDDHLAQELDESGIFYIIGDATSDDVLLKAGLKKAKQRENLIAYLKEATK